MPNLRKFHFLSAATLGIFLSIHMLNHASALWGLETHIDFMTRARTLYRNPIFELLLVSLLLFQIASGLTMLFRIWRERSGFVGSLRLIISSLSRRSLRRLGLGYVWLRLS